MKTSYTIILTLIVFSLFSCAGAPKKPVWITTNQSPQHPEHSFLKGVGYAKERETATANAKADLAKIFKTRIESTQISINEAYRVLTQNQSDETATRQFKQVTQESTSKTLEDVQIAQTYFAKDENLYYALAVLDRSKAILKLTEDIQTLDTAIAMHMEKSQAEDKMTRIFHLQRALVGLAERKLKDEEFRVVGQSGASFPSQYTLETVTETLRSLLFNAFNIAITISGDGATEIQGFIIEGLNQKGYTVLGKDDSSTDQEKTDVTITGDISIQNEDAALSTGDQQVRYAVNIKLIHQSTKKIIKSISFNNKLIKRTADRAYRQAIKKIGESLREQVVDTLLNFAP